MKFFSRHHSIKHFWIALLALLLLGSALRIHKYWEFPVVGETQDETAWTFLGGSLLQTGKPTSWSYFSAYETSTLTDIGGNSFPLVTPALDHPPLFSLLPGSIISLLGKPWNELPSSKVIRLPMVLLGILNLGLFSWWMIRVKQHSLATLLAVGFFALTPGIVFLSRLVVSENLLITWWLVILLCLSYPASRKRNVILFFAQAALPLTKVAGLATAVATVVVTYKEKNTKTWHWALAGLMAGITALCLYAALFDFRLFVDIQTQQAARDTGMLSLLSTLFWNASLVRHSFADPWWLVGIVSTMGWFLWSPISKKVDTELNFNLKVFFLAQFAFLLLSVGEQTVHGWYRMVLVPLFAYVIGTLGQSLFQEKQWLSLAVVWLWVGLWVRQALLFVLGNEFYFFQSTANKLWLCGAGLCVLASVFLMPKSPWQHKLWLVTCGILLFVVVLSQSVTIITINLPTYWQDAAYIETGLRP